MNIDFKIESKKIADEILNGTVEQAVEDYLDILGNYKFVTSSTLDKSFIQSMGTELSKFVRKNPLNYLEFCKQIWYSSDTECRSPLGIILGFIEEHLAEEVINESILMCKSSQNVDDVDIVIKGIEPVILRNPENYFHILEGNMKDDNIWLKRMILIIAGKIMSRHKSSNITLKCLEVIRPEILNGSEEIRKTASWVLASYGIRADQQAIATYMETFQHLENPGVVWIFGTAIKKTKISLQEDVTKSLVDVFSIWSNSKNCEVQKGAKNALAALASG